MNRLPALLKKNPVTIVIIAIVLGCIFYQYGSPEQVILATAVSFFFPFFMLTAFGIFKSIRHGMAFTVAIRSTGLMLPCLFVAAFVIIFFRGWYVFGVLLGGSALWCALLIIIYELKRKWDNK